MKVIFGSNRRPASLLIRLFTWSRYSHVGIVVNNAVVESTFENGVSTVGIEEFKSRYTKWEIAEIDGDQSLVSAYIGQGYDIGAIFGIFFRVRKWNDPGKWFCSELVAKCSNVFRENRQSRITPEHIYMTSKKVTAWNDKKLSSTESNTKS